jgi:uncharacterized protein YecT (DUF1311 family)
LILKKIIFLLFFALFLEAKEHKFEHCHYDGSYESPVQAEFSESECLGDMADYFQDMLSLKEKEFVKKIPAELYADFNQTKKSWQSFVDENMYEYAYFIGGYPYVIELQTFRANETLKRLDEIENLLHKHLGCDVKDTICLKEQFALKDKELNALYEKTMNSLSVTMRKNLRNVQRRWIRYKEGECSLFVTDLQDGMYEYYSNKKSLQNKKIMCQTDLTKKRVDALNMIYMESKK